MLTLAAAMAVWVVIPLALGMWLLARTFGRGIQSGMQPVRAVRWACLLLVAGGASAALGACTSGDSGRVAPPASGAPAGVVRSPSASLTPIDPGPPPVLTVPPAAPGEVARVVVTRSGTGKAFRNVRGDPASPGRTYTVEVACAGGRPSTGTSYAIYDAAPGTWGHGEPLYSRPFPCDGQVQRTVHLGLPAGAVQIDVRGLPPDAVAAYALIRPE